MTSSSHSGPSTWSRKRDSLFSDSLSHLCVHYTVTTATSAEQIPGVSTSVIHQHFNKQTGGATGKESACQRRRCGFHTWVGKIPWRRKWQPTPLLLPGKFHGQRSLAGCSPRGAKIGQDGTHTHRYTSSM